jgi:diadenosine tetraphosphate (Ap4A) HIT family hydrolase
MKRKILDLKSARRADQLQQMEEIIKDGVCPFCPKHLEKYHQEPTIKESRYWILTKNDYPYEGSKYHFLIIHKKHIDSIEKISSDASADLIKIISWANKKFNIRGGSFFMRFGDMEYNGSSVSHLHAHLITGIKRNKNTESLKVKLAYKKIK